MSRILKIKRQKRLLFWPNHFHMSLICTKFRNIGIMLQSICAFPCVFDVINIKIFMLSIKRTYLIRKNIWLSPFNLWNSHKGNLKYPLNVYIWVYFDNCSCSLKIIYVTIYLLNILYRCLNKKLLIFLKWLFF